MTVIKSLSHASTMQHRVRSAPPTVPAWPTRRCGMAVDVGFEDCDADLTDQTECPYGQRQCTCAPWPMKAPFDFAVMRASMRMTGSNVTMAIKLTCGCLIDCRIARPKICTVRCDANRTLLADNLAHHRTLREATPLSGNYFGSSVAIQGDLIAVGTSQTDLPIDEEDRSGTISLFHRNRLDQWVPGQILRYSRPWTRDCLPFILPASLWLAKPSPSMASSSPFPICLSE